MSLARGKPNLLVFVAWSIMLGASLEIIRIALEWLHPWIEPSFFALGRANEYS